MAWQESPCFYYTSRTHDADARDDSAELDVLTCSDRITKPVQQCCLRLLLQSAIRLGATRKTSAQKVACQIIDLELIQQLLGQTADMISVLVLLSLFPYAFALKFDLQAFPPGEAARHERCIRNFVPSNTLVVVTTTISGYKGDGQVVNMHIKDSMGSIYGKPKDVVGRIGWPSQVILTANSTCASRIS
ncbi:hypothetical protein MRB53_040616 [Persea americana]|nr:hypothetical protein MRB53_040616 [Persea americana]